MWYLIVRPNEVQKKTLPISSFTFLIAQPSSRDLRLVRAVCCINLHLVSWLPWQMCNSLTRTDQYTFNEGYYVVTKTNVCNSINAWLLNVYNY
jgi:hypothetical protein